MHPAVGYSPVKGVPSVRFDFSLSRESEAEADKLTGRVGADPGQVTQGNGKPTGPPPEMLAAEQEKKKGGLLGGLFRK